MHREDEEQRQELRELSKDELEIVAGGVNKSGAPLPGGGGDWGGWVDPGSITVS